ncbi:LysR family transcriptional regulator ArgP [Paenibacillus sp. TRM 82003]|uniref:LysR family transcriptional regulator ArgP n=1 Tax=Kineococcus sp. TRM81007 TaxID=2925831 RepID=UPI001F568C2B|nr:LysR family transcriptional regulator ArgP [Kineococcus sp. TRM81007]MCI2237663.1 LysR family transcriptional regulator ArgP [Kineococcus sp. TRM81007]MCI3921680.1 LysR family transcriptional regulator ArgP [Paenibacillus sp. TRM 82003]
MDLDLGQLRALSAAVSGGTFEAAARALHVTPSAISQRLRALEVATGRVLLVRSRPVRPTGSGEVLLRLARQVELLAGDTLAELDADGAGGPAPRGVQTLPIAVNADSLATWALPALAPLAGSACFEIHREDEGRTASLLREGTVVAAVTTDAEPVSGCSVTRLGAMRYRPLVAAARAREWFPDGPTAQALARAPVVVFDREDDLQHRYLRRRLPGTQRAAQPPVHHVPSSADFLTAVRLGLGWGMLPDLQSRPDEADGSLVDVDPSGAVDVVLHWQQWKLRSASLDRVAAAVTAAARRHLVQ